MDPGLHNAAYLDTKRLKLGHWLQASADRTPEPNDRGLSAVLAWQGLLAWQGHGPEPERAEAEHWQSLRAWTSQRQLEFKREEHPRLLALLERPDLAILLTPAAGQQLEEAALTAVLSQMATWPHTRAVSLLLTPDSQRSSHPSVTLEPEQRPLLELRQRSPQLPLQPGAFLRWQ
jgi:3,4-dihydroxy 2-butanone 4-phosphate synthase/GTP cyclohydrolase II